MAARERWLREVGTVLHLRGRAFFGGVSGVSASRFKRPDPEPELEPEKEEVSSAPNIPVTDYCATRLPDL